MSVVRSRSSVSLWRTSGCATSTTFAAIRRRHRTPGSRARGRGRAGGARGSRWIRAAQRAAGPAPAATRLGDDRADLAAVGLVEPAHRRRRRAEAHARGDRRRALVERHRVAVRRDRRSRRAGPPPALPVSSDPRRSSSTRWVSVPPVRARARPACDQPSASAAALSTTCAGSRGRPGSRRSRSTTAFAAITWHERPALQAGEDGRSTSPGELRAAEHEARARSGERLVRRRVTMSADSTGFGCTPAGDEPREVRHVDHQQRADLVGDLAEGRAVDLARVGRAAGDDQLRPVLVAARRTSSMSMRSSSRRTP